MSRDPRQPSTAADAAHLARTATRLARHLGWALTDRALRLIVTALGRG